MRNYIPQGKRRSKDRYFCSCGNNVFSTLPEIHVKMTEVIPCPRCFALIQFSTVALPEKIGYPISRRQWGETTELVWRAIPA